MRLTVFVVIFLLFGGILFAPCGCAASDKAKKTEGNSTILDVGDSIGADGKGKGKNKTKVKEYWKGDVGWEGFLGALEQNRRAIQSAKSVDVTRREPQEISRAEFQASVTKLRPLLERIELTHKLIDQMVYKLYGLTDAEITVVEDEASLDVTN